MGKPSSTNIKAISRHIKQSHVDASIKPCSSNRRYQFSQWSFFNKAQNLISYYRGSGQNWYACALLRVVVFTTI